MRIEEPAVDTADAADLAEQRAELDDDSFEGSSEGGSFDGGSFDGGSAGRVPRADLPLEADPADVAEQDAVVPYDDDH